MKLTILKQEWKDGNQFPEECDWSDNQKLNFRKYTDMADYLDSHPELQNKVMIVRPNNKVLGNKVIFNDFVFVEGYGYV